ncbi:MAG: hypothetical protein II871_04175 [Clostridia bacterium]|nr:hypothetical protein [Clostridia bacterium]
MDMRALYYIYLPSERAKNEDAQKHDEDVKANENCLNQNFSLLAGKVYEFEARINMLEGALERANAALNAIASEDGRS